MYRQHYHELLFVVWDQYASFLHLDFGYWYCLLLDLVVDPCLDSGLASCKLLYSINGLSFSYQNYRDDDEKRFCKKEKKKDQSEGIQEEKRERLWRLHGLTNWLWKTAFTFHLIGSFLTWLR